MLEVADLQLHYPEFAASYSLVVPGGAFCGLVGPSGGGKTTLLHVVAGFAQPVGGILRFGGRNLLGLKPVDRPLSMLFQEHNLFPHLTAEQNVGLGIRPSLRLQSADRAAVARALTRVGLEGLAGRRPSELSGGQRQRVGIARALVRHRPLMLMDEPFGGLDPGLRLEMVDLIDALRREEGLTVLVSIHTPEDLGGAADMMAFIAGGTVIAAGLPSEVLMSGRHAAIDQYLGRPRAPVNASLGALAELHRKGYRAPPASPIERTPPYPDTQSSTLADEARQTALKRERP